jgi:hypothetical protein
MARLWIKSIWGKIKELTVLTRANFVWSFNKIELPISVDKDSFNRHQVILRNTCARERSSHLNSVLISGYDPARRYKLSYRINNELLYFTSAFVPESRISISATNTNDSTLPVRQKIDIDGRWHITN